MSFYFDNNPMDCRGFYRLGLPHPKCANCTHFSTGANLKNLSDGGVSDCEEYDPIEYEDEDPDDLFINYINDI